MRLWQRLGNRNLYLSVLIIVLGNLLLTIPVQNFLINKIKLTGPVWLLDFISFFLVTFVLLLTTLEVFEL